MLLLLRQLYVLSSRPSAEADEPPKEPTIFIALEEFSSKKVWPRPCFT